MRQGKWTRKVVPPRIIAVACASTNQCCSNVREYQIIHVKNCAQATNAARVIIVYLESARILMATSSLWPTLVMVPVLWHLGNIGERHVLPLATTQSIGQATAVSKRGASAT